MKTLDVLTYLYQNFAGEFPINDGNPISNDGATTADLSLQRIEGIDQRLLERLNNADIDNLGQLAEVEASEVKVSGIGQQRLQSFVNMAKFLVAYPQLDGNDAELAVKGFGLSRAETLGELSEISSSKVNQVMQKLKLPADYSPENLLTLAKQFRDSVES